MTARIYFACTGAGAGRPGRDSEDSGLLELAMAAYQRAWLPGSAAIGGRTVDGQFMTARHLLDAAQVPVERRALFRELDGRRDVSSSDARRAG